MSNIKNWDPSATSLECFVLIAGARFSQGAWHFTPPSRQCSGAQQQEEHITPSSERDALYIIVVTSLFLSFLGFKKVDPVYCKVELIPHHRRLWDSGQEICIINTDKLLTSYIQRMMCGLSCQGGCWFPSKTQTIQEPNLLSDFFLCVTKLAAFLCTDTHIPPPLPMP